MKKMGPDQKRNPRNIDQRNLSKQLEEIQFICGQYTEFNGKNAKTFDDFPLSSRTKLGLKLGKFVDPTEIQSESLSLALRGLDILGAAKTGSGKTLAFLIPTLECLWRNRWSKWDGLGALIVSPTRELALQTFDVLRKIGKKHDFSAALVIGGTSWEFEKERISGTNIVVCTPGRLLQHMDENPHFTTDSLQILVLDEADRILDLGFQQQINAVIENLPPRRQTLLFSATQTRSVKDLARLSLQDPVFVSVHEHSSQSTPEQLLQSYVVCEDWEKVNFLWSFLKSHKQKKVLVFMTSCKQVRFYCEAFKRVKPGMVLFGLYGTMNPLKRLEVYEEFCGKEIGTLLATDVAARGLDFPAVNWVVQLDCPPDAEEYIHRSGRTARYKQGGEALLVLTPSQEIPMLKQLKEKKVPEIQKIQVNEQKVHSLTKKLEAICAKDATLKNFAQKCFVSYPRSVYMMRNKEVFDVETVAVEKYAKSLGLPFAPRVRYLKKKGVKFAEEKSSIFSRGDLEEPEDLFLHLAKKDVFGILDGVPKQDDEPMTLERRNQNPLSKEALGRKLLRKKKTRNKKILFDDSEEHEREGTSDNRKPQSHDSDNTVAGIKLTEPPDMPGLNIEAAIEKMKEVDRFDRKAYKERLKARKRERKMRRKLAEAERKNRPLLQKKLGVTLAGMISAADSGGEMEEENEVSTRKQRKVDTLKTEEEIALQLLLDT